MPLGTCIKKLLLRNSKDTQTQQSTAGTENLVTFSQYVRMKKSHLGGALVTAHILQKDTCLNSSSVSVRLHWHRNMQNIRKRFFVKKDN